MRKEEEKSHKDQQLEIRPQKKSVSLQSETPKPMDPSTILSLVLCGILVVVLIVIGIKKYLKYRKDNAPLKLTPAEQAQREAVYNEMMNMPDEVSSPF